MPINIGVVNYHVKLNIFVLLLFVMQTDEKERQRGKKNPTRHF